jgi:NADH dehydrogenase
VRANENHKLPNLTIAAKLTSSAALVVGWSVYAFTWIVSIVEASWASGTATLMEAWGTALATLAWSETGIYLVLFTVHAASLVFLAITGRWLIARASLRRHARSLCKAAIRTFIVLDLTVWALVPFVTSVRQPAAAFAMAATATLGCVTLLGLVQMWIFKRWRPKGGRKRVVIVGGGFAGLYAALGLDRKLGYHPDLEIVLLDRRNYFLFPPLLPSAASGAIELRQVANPFRRILESTNVVFRKAMVESIDTATRRIVAHVEKGEHAEYGEAAGHDLELSYDVLVLAPGSRNQTFNTPGVAEHAFFMKELSDANNVRNHVIDCFERAAAGASDDARRELLTFVVVGAGPTGVEVATEIHDLIFKILLRRYPELDPSWVSIVLVQSGGQVLPGWRESVVRIATEQLERLNCKTQLNCRVSKVTAGAVELAGGASIPTRTCIWCAGVAPSPLLERAGLPLDASGRVRAEGDLRAESLPDVFVLGDACFRVDPRTGKPLPPLGQVAFQQGSHTAANIVRMLAGKTTRPFRYFNHGSLVSVGEHFAAVDLMGVQVSGFIGWFIWRTLYLAKMVGVGNRVRIVFDWTLDLLIERSVAQTQ